VGYLWCVVVEYSFGMTTSTSASIQTSYQELQKVQKEIGKLFNNKQILTAQLRENELVKTEVDLLDESSTIYKLVGPVMVTQDYAEVKNTVDSRIDYLKTELEKVDRKLESLESKAVIRLLLTEKRLDDWVLGGTS